MGVWSRDPIERISATLQQWLTDRGLPKPVVGRRESARDIVVVVVSDVGVECELRSGPRSSIEAKRSYGEILDDFGSSTTKDRVVEYVIVVVVIQRSRQV